MPKAYWIAHVDVSNPDGYKQYIEANVATFTKYPSTLLVRGGDAKVVEGRMRSRNVVREFKDFATAHECYKSPEYALAKPHRLANSAAELLIVDGYEGPQPPPPTQPPPVSSRKGYWIGHVDVIDPAAYRAYMAADMAPIGQYGGRFVVRGGWREMMEGQVRGRTVVVEFPSREAALACYRSPEYQAAAALRKGKAAFDLCIVEQYDGPQLP